MASITRSIGTSAIVIVIRGGAGWAKAATDDKDRDTANSSEYKLLICRINFLFILLYKF